MISPTDAAKATAYTDIDLFGEDEADNPKVARPHAVVPGKYEVRTFKEAEARAEGEGKKDPRVRAPIEGTKGWDVDGTFTVPEGFSREALAIRSTELGVLGVLSSILEPMTLRQQDHHAELLADALVTKRWPEMTRDLPFRVVDTGQNLGNLIQYAQLLALSDARKGIEAERAR